MVVLLYSPVCEKLPVVRAAVQQHNLELREINLWEVNEASFDSYPGYIQEAIERLWSGEDGFYAWKIFQDGREITREFEELYPFNYAYPDLSWKGDFPEIDHRKLEIKLLTMERLDQGITGPGAFCLGPLRVNNQFTDIQQMRRELYREICQRTGCLGLTVDQDDLTLGFLLFLPKDEARRAGYYTSRSDVDMGQTLIISCFYVPGELRGEGLAGRLVAELKRLAPLLGYHRIEVAATERYFDNEYTWWSREPFAKAGFKHIEDRDYPDGYPMMQIWGWEI